MNNQEIKYWSIIILLSYIPTIGIHLLVRPLWYQGISISSNTALFEDISTLLFLPLYLVLINYFLAKKNEKKPLLFIINAIIILTCIPLSAFLGFKNWADETGMGSNPDVETLFIVKGEAFWGSAISLIGIIIAFVQLKRGERTIAK